MAKKTLRINESTLRKLIKESVKKVLKEEYVDSFMEDIKAKYPQVIKQLFNNPDMVVYFWVIDIAREESILSDRCFSNEDQAADDCDRNEYSEEYDCYVMSLGVEDGELISDCVLAKERPIHRWMD